MTAMNKYIFTLAFFSALAGQLIAQPGTTQKFEPEFRRLINHEAIDKEQKTLLDSDGLTDKQLTASSNAEVNMLLTRALVNEVDELQYNIEKDSILDHRLKVNYLSGLANTLRYVRVNWKNRKVNVLHLGEIIDGYKEAMQLDRENKSIVPVIEPLAYDAGSAIIAANIFEKKCRLQNFKRPAGIKILHLTPGAGF